MVEYLFSICEALGSIPRTAKEKKKCSFPCAMLLYFCSGNAKAMVVRTAGALAQI